MKKILIVIILLFLSAFLFWQTIYLPKEFGPNQGALFIIEKERGAEQIAIDLEEQGLIKSAFLFRLYALCRGSLGKLQAGAYLLSPSMNMPQILKKIVSGDVVRIEITIPEGFRIEQIISKVKTTYPPTAALLPSGQAPCQKLNLQLKNQKLSFYKDNYDFLQDAPDEVSLEGYLFPDTYYFSFTEEAEQEFIEKMLNNFGKKLTPDLREEIKNQGKTIFQIVTMASLLEREVKSFEDRQIVAGILWKRLQNNIPLQVDATITYITGQTTGRVSREETQIDSAYNTYKHLGLPLGPICNPGLDSIKAALYPEDSPYWYYLSADDGTTIFSRTLEEHNVAKARYLE
jgi:UPF0755 protein